MAEQDVARIRAALRAVDFERQRELYERSCSCPYTQALLALLSSGRDPVDAFAEVLLKLSAERLEVLDKLQDLVMFGNPGAVSSSRELEK